MQVGTRGARVALGERPSAQLHTYDRQGGREEIPSFCPRAALENLGYLIGDRLEPLLKDVTDGVVSVRKIPGSDGDVTVWLNQPGD